MMQLVWTLSS